MWAIDNQTVYAADRTWVRDKHGRHHWIVVVKATFDFQANGALQLADEQLPPLHEAEYFGELDVSSLRYEADLVARKPGTDVIVNAHAHAPGGQAVREVIVGLRIGALEKPLLVRGESKYGFGITGIGISNPEPFVTRPIRYEHAYGGTDLLAEDRKHHRVDLRNPVGVGVASRNEHLYGRSAPSVYYPRGNPATVGPAGFGAVAGHWSPRLELGGTYGARWAAEKQPLLPDDYDETQLLCAPADQRIAGHLRGGEVIALINLTPAGALGLTLPSISLTATTRVRGRAVEQPLELVTVVIEPREGRLIMAWQSALFIAAPEVDDVDETRVRERC